MIYIKAMILFELVNFKFFSISLLKLMKIGNSKKCLTKEKEGHLPCKSMSITAELK